MSQSICWTEDALCPSDNKFQEDPDDNYGFLPEIIPARISCHSLDGENSLAPIIELGGVSYRSNPPTVQMDPIEGKIYWMEADEVSRVRRASVNISPYGDEVVEDIIPSATHFTLDIYGKKIYSVGTAGTIIRSNLDGTGEEKFTSNAGSNIALDLVNDKLYWTLDGTIQRANLDGSKIEDVVNGYEFQVITAKPDGMVQFDSKMGTPHPLTNQLEIVRFRYS